MRKENAEKDSGVDFGNETSFEKQNVITTEGDTEKQTKGQDKNIGEFKYKGKNKNQEIGTISNLFKKQKGVTSPTEKKQTTKIYFEDMANFTANICAKIAVDVGKEILPIVIPSKNNIKDNTRLQGNTEASSNDCLPENEIAENVSDDQLSFTRNQPGQIQNMKESCHNSAFIEDKNEINTTDNESGMQLGSSSSIDPKTGIRSTPNSIFDEIGINQETANMMRRSNMPSDGMFR